MEIAKIHLKKTVFSDTILSNSMKYGSVYPKNKLYVLKIYCSQTGEVINL